MRAFATIAASLLVLMLLAGCVSDEPNTPDQANGQEPSDSEALSRGKGAIAGLLVDDRFRPIHLVDDPQGEFQTTGFILLQETGQQVQTNANGEFRFVNLNPGTYTLRATAAGHEGIPQRITVTEGQFSEASMLMRRITSQGSLIITEEYTGFVACGISLGATTVITNCIDTSGESDRRGGRFNFDLFSNVTYMIMEVRVDDPGHWLIQVSGTGRSPQYGNVRINDDVYAKRIYEYDGDYDGANPTPWMNDQPVDTLIFFGGDIDNPGPGDFGFGAAIGKRVRILASVFLGPPEVDLEAYQVLTPDST